MKIVIYSHEKMLRAGNLLNALHVSGCDNFRILAELSDILDSGEIKDRHDPKKSCKEDGHETD